MSSEFVTALKVNQQAFNIELSESFVERLSDYYELVQEHNSQIHLVAPCSHEEFAIRHILESLALLEFIPKNAKFADVGAGAGLPSIPCLLVRDDLSAVLIETKVKKAQFLEDAIERLGLVDRAKVINRQFEETDISDCKFVTCRALDKFTERLPRLLKWAKGKTLVLFSGPALAVGLEKLRGKCDRRLLPLSDQRFLFIIGEH